MLILLKNSIRTSPYPHLLVGSQYARYTGASESSVRGPVDVRSVVNTLRRDKGPKLEPGRC